MTRDAEPLPCVGCGYCCRKVQCLASAQIHGFRRRCPELYFENDIWRCRLAEDPQMRIRLHIGAGCCSTLNSDRRNIPTPETARWG